MIIIPEEVEILIPLFREVENSPTHLLTYAAPVTRKMLCFNDLAYFAIPALPAGWKPPAWLVIELGIFAGRLYFEFDEYNELREFLGYQEDPTVAPTEGHGNDDTADEAKMTTGIPQTQSFTAKPLTFLLEWLAIRRKGQNFSHTPMGYVSQGKLLTAKHPFFAHIEKNIAPQPRAADVSDARGNPAADTESDLAEDEMIDDDEYFLDGDDASIESEGNVEQGVNESFDLDDPDEINNTIQN